MSVIITMTTCRRFALFSITVQSLLAHCEECRHVPWLIVDDGSSEHTEMEFVLRSVNHTIVWKDQKDKGHDKSMNMIQNMTKDYKYVFHLEDDWEFVHTRRYLSESIKLLESHPIFGQVLVNQDYLEVLDDPRDIVGSVDTCKHLQGSARMHVFDPSHSLCGTGQLSNGHWPHYSLRPGLLRRSMWTFVGSFTEGHSEFEKEYGIRYMAAGFVTIFHKGVHCIHLGKKSWESEEENPSAYSLNKVDRF